MGVPPPALVGTLRRQKSYRHAQSLRTMWLLVLILNFLGTALAAFLSGRLASSEVELVAAVGEYSLLFVLATGGVSILFAWLYVRAIEVAIERHQSNKLAMLGILSFLAWLPTGLLIGKIGLAVAEAETATVGAAGASMGDIPDLPPVVLLALVLILAYIIFVFLFLVVSLAAVLESCSSRPAEAFYDNGWVVSPAEEEDLQSLNGMISSASPGIASPALMQASALPRCRVGKFQGQTLAFSVRGKKGKELVHLQTAHQHRNCGAASALLEDFRRETRGKGVVSKANMSPDEEAFLQRRGLGRLGGARVAGATVYGWP